MRAFRFAMVLGLLLFMGVSTSANAAPNGARTVDVTIQNFAYSPNPITIDPGDTIRWTNLDSASHSAVSVNPGFISAVIGQNQTTLVTIDRPGTYEYVCAVHGASMKGTVIVRGTPVDTPVPVGPVGHVVDDQFQQARPDVFQTASSGTTAVLYVSALLALAAVARFVWVVRHS